MAEVNSSDLVHLEDGSKVVRVPDLVNEKSHVVFAQCTSAPLSPDKPYFRVKVVQLAKEAVIAIGISQETDLDAEDVEDDEVDRPSKRKSDAVVYFSDDGSIASPARKGSKEFVQTFGQGDVVGLYIDYHSKHKSLVCVLKNDQLVHRRWLALKEDLLLPTVNVWWGTAELHVDWLSSSPPVSSQENLSDWNMPDTVTADDNLLSLRTSSKVAAIQAPFPLHKSSTQYLEMTIVSMGEEATVGPVIGLTSALLDDTKLPGTMMEAVGYSGADGTVYFETAENATKLGENCTCGVGDTMGCGLVFVETEVANPRLPTNVIVYFTKNGQVVHQRSLDQPMGGFYPTIGLACQGCTVRVNTECPEPTSLDVSAWRAEAIKKAMRFGGFGLISSKQSTGPKHIEGETSGNFRFNELLGVPSDNVIRLKEKTSRMQLIQLLKTMTPDQPYFTVTITEEDADGRVVMGISRSGQSVGVLPGDVLDTVGYSCEGAIYNGVDRFKTEKYTKGDEVGCFAEYFGESVKIVQFVKNGQLVGLTPLTGGSQDIYPSLGFVGEPCAVRVSWPDTRPTPPGTFSKDMLSNWMKSTGLCVRDFQLSVQKKMRKLKAMCLRSPQPLTRAWSYFEVTIHSKVLSTPAQKVSKAPVVGLTNDMGLKPFKKLTNDERTRDIRYYCHSNSIGFKDALLHKMVSVNEYLGNGDRLGFGIVYPAIKNQPSDRAQQVVVVYCTVNGSVIHHQAMQQPEGGFYPIISLYKYGSEVDIIHNSSPPSMGDIGNWLADAEFLRKEIARAKKDAAGDHRQTAEERQARPASPVERTENHLNKYKIYIYCDPVRYNEATHIQSRLETKGFNTVLPSRDALNSSSLSSDQVAAIRTCDSLVCCVGPEISTSQRALATLDLCKESSRPILPCILTHVAWPPEGLTQEHFQMLTLDKIEMTEDFHWGVEQVGEKTLNLRGKGYNGKLIKVELGDAAEMLYTDAQKGNKTSNKVSDPDALKAAMEDADQRKATSFGNTSPNGSPSGSTPRDKPQDRPQSVKPSGKPDRASSGKPRAKSAGAGGQGSGGIQKSKMCSIL
ncbi:uncharacterized protein LOC110979466 [Acanthaster planci]|uniref:Uncharacterized protein LOC110979466 n=1 Tax=Acanthaster planci TaxID=133434 RepID=A0A8B7YH54_ACAPL|nr:uncharacterized protein LOC110979466 [Acanthaster planci]